MLENEIQNEADGQVNQGGGSISSYVNQSIVSQLIEMGFTKAVAEKALFFNLSKQGEPLDMALAWISEHSDDPDFLEELQIVGQEESAKKSTLTKEERLQKAKELQESIRRKRAAEEKRLKEEQEKSRIASTKQMQEIKRKMEEQQQKIALDQQKREKKEFMDAKAKMLEQLQRDREERFGKKAGVAAGA